MASLHEVIEDERARLAQAEAVIECLRLALISVQEGHEVSRKRRVDFAEVAELAESLVRESINRLDSLYVGPLFERIAAGEPHIAQE